MRSMSLVAVAEAVSGQLIGRDTEIAEISTDSRKMPEAALFVALRGERFDAHDFLDQAKNAGAAALMVECQVDLGLPQILVPDCRLALGQLARAWRQASPAKVLALTGSNGKTSLKEMLKAILSADGTDVLATQGNLNNDIGVPLTLLRLENEPLAVVEMGANHPGEISYLTQLVLPEVAILNNAGRAHLEGFGSLEGVARAKAEILHGLKAGGHFIYPAESPWAGLWQQLAQDCKTLTFGFSDQAQVRSPESSIDMAWTDAGFVSRFSIKAPGLVSKPISIELTLAGEHNRHNALAAAAAALVLGISGAQISQGLGQLQPVPGRLHCQKLAGAWLVDDSYNANPDSFSAAIRVLATAPGRTTLVLGDMGELGPDAAHLHEAVGAEAKAAAIQRLYGLGKMAAAAVEAFGSGAEHFTERDALVQALIKGWQAGEAILIKGSRSAAMDLVVKALEQHGTTKRQEGSHP